MRFSAIAIGAALSLLITAAASAQVARPGDKAVKQLIENVLKALDEFEDKLDSKIKKGTIRGAQAEVNVDQYFEDFDTDLERLEERFKAKYSASAEVLTVLRKATDIDRFIDSQPASLKGRSEWDVAEASLKQLAEAYGTTFPLTAGAPGPRRINDQEVEEAADAMVEDAGAFKKAAKDAFGKDKDAMSKAQKAVDALSSSAKALKSRIGSGKPASGEAGAVAEQYAAVEAAVAGRTLSPKAEDAWKGVKSAMDKINQTFENKPAAAEAPPAPVTHPVPPPAQPATPETQPPAPEDAQPPAATDGTTAEPKPPGTTSAG